MLVMGLVMISNRACLLRRLEVCLEESLNYFSDPHIVLIFAQEIAVSIGEVPHWRLVAFNDDCVRDMELENRGTGCLLGP